MTELRFPEEGGILVFREGEQFFMKGLPFLEAVRLADIIKRSVLNAVKFALSSPVRYFVAPVVLLPAFLKRRLLLSALTHYTDFTERMASTIGVLIGQPSAYLNPRYFSTAVREVYRVGMLLAGDSVPLRRLVEAVAHVLEFDDAYRYRVQDLFGEVNLAALEKNPGRELARVFALCASRGETTVAQFTTFARVIPYLFRLRDVREATRAFFREADLSKLRLDQADMYRCLKWGGYDFGGVSFAERLNVRAIVDTLPTLRPT